MELLCNVAGIKHSVTKGYDVRRNVVSEGAIGRLKRMPKKKIELSDGWDMMLASVFYECNVMQHESHWRKPVFVLYGIDRGLRSTAFFLKFRL